ncbi:MAG: nicotinate-nucleotide adenylyltransferase [Bacteroidales bacterium]|nr:MAG: nicotinate-nucleotide adenylyltransferase [Bacteroidales bacterium]
MKVGLYFGSFNPVHIGHLAIANYIVEFTDIDQLWFVLSPQNPLKKKTSLLNDYDRYDLLKKAIGEDNSFQICDIELRLPKPSYTIDTLTYLKERNPGFNFILIMGSDVLTTFHKWKNHEEIIKNYQRYIYPRRGFENINLKDHKNIKVIDAPLIEISSSFIRSALKHGKNVRYFLPEEVYKYILKKHLYNN